MIENTCCFFGHRKIEITDRLKMELYNSIKKLIIQENVYRFLFGSNSEFDDLCYQIVSELKSEYSNITRVYVRAEYAYIDDNYREYLLKRYEDTYYPDSVIKAGKSAYIKRNHEMINTSKYCVIYYNENYVPSKQKRSNCAITNSQSKSGTKIAYDYAVKKQRIIINMFS